MSSALYSTYYCCYYLLNERETKRMHPLVVPFRFLTKQFIEKGHCLTGWALSGHGKDSLSDGGLVQVVQVQLIVEVLHILSKRSLDTKQHTGT